MDCAMECEATKNFLAWISRSSGWTCELYCPLMPKSVKVGRIFPLPLCVRTFQYNRRSWTGIRNSFSCFNLSCPLAEKWIGCRGCVWPWHRAVVVVLLSVRVSSWCIVGDLSLLMLRLLVGVLPSRLHRMKFRGYTLFFSSRAVFACVEGGKGILGLKCIPVVWFIPHQCFCRMFR